MHHFSLLAQCASTVSLSPPPPPPALCNVDGAVAVRLLLAVELFDTRLHLRRGFCKRDNISCNDCDCDCSCSGLELLADDDDDDDDDDEWGEGLFSTIRPNSIDDGPLLPPPTGRNKPPD